MQDTIFALATGSPPCAVAIIRVSGAQARAIGEAFGGAPLTPRRADYRTFRDPATGEPIDTGLLLFFSAPHSFTGEDCLEFQTHGSRAVVTRLLRALSAWPGARQAKAGEFIRRAFESDKLDLTTVEGVADLIDARTDLQLRQALAQAGGRLADQAELWRQDLLETSALIAAEIDFADEGEAPSGVAGEVLAKLGRVRDGIAAALADARRGEMIRAGFRVVIAGPPNAGKSSLLNALARRDVAIVTEHAGTTRDVLTVELDLDGAPVVISDTAGLRETADPVESIGVERSTAEIARADLVLWLTPSNEACLEEAPEGALSVATKADLSSLQPAWADLAISTHTGEGLDSLVEAVSRTAGDALRGEPPLVTQERQRALLLAASRQIESLVAEGVEDLELLAEDIRRIVGCLDALVGSISVDDVLGTLFSRFCMGK